jgi:hypothetical protein
MWKKSTTPHLHGTTADELAMPSRRLTANSGPKDSVLQLKILTEYYIPKHKYRIGTIHTPILLEALIVDNKQSHSYT